MQIIPDAQTNFENTKTDYTDPRTFTDLPLTLKEIDRENPAEFQILPDGTYRLFYKPKELYRYCPPEFLERPEGKSYPPSVALHGFDVLCRHNGMRKKLSEIDGQELSYYCRETPLVPGNIIYLRPISRYYRNDDEPTVSIRPGVECYGWKIDPTEIIDFSYITSSSVGKHAHKTLYRDVFTVWTIINGMSYASFKEVINKSDITSPKIYIQRAVSRSAIKALLDLGILDMDSLGKYLENAQKLMYEEAAAEVFRKVPKREGLIGFDAEIFLPFLDKDYPDMLPDECFIPFLMSYIRTFFEKIAENVQIGTIVSLTEVLNSIVKTREYIDKLLVIYGKSRSNVLFPLMDYTYKYLAERYSELNRQIIQPYLDRREEKKK